MQGGVEYKRRNRIAGGWFCIHGVCADVCNGSQKLGEFEARTRLGNDSLKLNVEMDELPGECPCEKSISTEEIVEPVI